MGRAYEKVMENRKRLAAALMENIKTGNLVGGEAPENFVNPENPITKDSYRGINKVSLIMAAVERKCNDPRWMTFEQLKKEGYHLKSGSKGVLCEYWDFGQQVLEETQEELTAERTNTPRVGYYYVFNGGDIEGLVPYQEENINIESKDKVHDFIKNKLQEDKSANGIQNAFAGLFAELEQHIFQQDVCCIDGEKNEIDEKELFQLIRRAQLQSEKLVEEYRASLLKQAINLEAISDAVDDIAEKDVKEEQTEQISENKNLGKIEDFGKKIGGARKDLWSRRGLSVADLIEMNAAERDKYVTKNNIWPKPNYEEMLQNGIPKNVVWFIKKVHDKLRSKPLTADNQERYVAFIQDLRATVMSIKSEDECKHFWSTFFIGKGYIEQGAYRIIPTEKLAGCLDNKFYKAVRVTQSDFDYMYEREMRKAQFGVPEEEKLPPGVRIAHYLSGSYGVYKGGKQFALCETRDEAVLWAKENLSRTQVRKQNYVPPQLTEIGRDGMDEVVTQPITGEDYMSTFGFYGGEFGNWMTAADRQQSLNMGFEAFHDLAVALGIDDQDISFGGKLAIAFGARGKGSAVAHYEPLRNVINLTKLRGAGFLAHEWGHALDDLVAKKLGFPKMMSQMGEQMPERMKEVLSAMKYVPGSGEKEKTEFYLAALKMDEQYSKSDKGYWASDCEMFARAFACYVKDKLSPGKNDYLCGHADGAGPRAEERKRINESMDRLIMTLKEQKLLEERVPEQLLQRTNKMKRGR